MSAYLAFLIGILSALLPVLCLWGVSLAGVGFNNPVWVPVVLLPILGLWAVFVIAKDRRP